MDRRALIISNAGEARTEEHCLGVRRDVINYTTFLRSPLGGLWKEKEIFILDKPSNAMTTIELAQQRRADYSITIFCGHGYHDNDSDSTILV
jgi:hypothetical protein